MNDLDRQSGRLLSHTVLELLSRGKSGIRQVARRLGPGAPDSRIADAVSMRGKQAIEMLHKAGVLCDELGQTVLSCVGTGDILAKSTEFWDRGERKEASFMADLVQMRDPEQPQLLVFRARESMAKDLFDDARVYYTRAISGGAGEAISVEAALAALERSDPSAAIRFLCGAGGEWSAERKKAASQALKALLSSADRESLMSAIGRLAGQHSEVLADLITQVTELGREAALLESDVIKDGLAVIMESADAILHLSYEIANEAIALEPVALDLAQAMSEAVEQVRNIGSTLGDYLAGSDAGGEALQARREASIGPVDTLLLDALLEVPADKSAAGSRLGQIEKRPSFDELVACTLIEARQRIRDSILLSPLGVIQPVVADIEEAMSQMISLLCHDSLANARRTVLSRDLGNGSRLLVALAQDCMLYLGLFRGFSPGYWPLGDVVSPVAASAAILAREYQVRFAASIERDLPKLRIDREQAGLLFQSICSSAVRASGRNGQAILRVRPESSGELIEVEVTSTAPQFIQSEPGRQALEIVCSRHGWQVAAEQNDTGSRLILQIPVSAEEHALSSQIRGYGVLSKPAKQALRAAWALDSAGTDYTTSSYLYMKALQIEARAIAAPLLKRHAILPRALALRDSIAANEAVKAALMLLPVPERDLRQKISSLVQAVIKDRLAKEISDVRGLATALAVFSEDVPRQMIEALHGAGEAFARSSGERDSLRMVRESVIKALGLLSQTRT